MHWNQNFFCHRSPNNFISLTSGRKNLKASPKPHIHVLEPNKFMSSPNNFISPISGRKNLMVSPKPHLHSLELKNLCQITQNFCFSLTLCKLSLFVSVSTQRYRGQKLYAHLIKSSNNVRKREEQKVCIRTLGKMKRKRGEESISDCEYSNSNLPVCDHHLFYFDFSF